MPDIAAPVFVQMRQPPAGRFLVVGDIHGELAMLQRLLRLAAYEPQHDRLIALGDLVDRGPQSREVLQWFAQNPGACSLLGNHEALMLGAAHDPRTEQLWCYNGGDWSRALGAATLAQLREQVAAFPLAIELQADDGRRIGLVHAELSPGLAWDIVRELRFDARQAVHEAAGSPGFELLWGRSRHRIAKRLCDPRAGPPDYTQLRAAVQTVAGVDLVIGGHSIVASHQPRRLGNCLAIDTGAYTARGRLTLVDPLAGRYWQVGRGEQQQWPAQPLPAPLLASV